MFTRRRLWILGLVLLAAWGLEVIRQSREQIERAGEIATFFTKDELVPAAENFHFFALESELLRQTHCLAISGAKDFGCEHTTNTR